MERTDGLSSATNASIAVIASAIRRTRPTSNRDGIRQARRVRRQLFERRARREMEAGRKSYGHVPTLDEAKAAFRAEYVAWLGTGKPRLG
jgi:hypothetical protein